jgi:NTE family protein
MEEADGVFRGGGVKGLGLAGALVGFAEHPDKPVKKWVNVAGASAGAIIASYLAAGHSADEMVELMKRTNFASFQDFPWGGKVVGGGRNFIRRHGLARGEAFRRWFSNELNGKTFESVKTPDGKDYRLKLIAVDATNRSLLVLPDDLALYRRLGDDTPIDPDTFEIADAARMSMSIPYFFEPVQLMRDRVFVEDAGDSQTIFANTFTDRLDVWHESRRLAAKNAKPISVREPTRSEKLQQLSLIIDGGTLSNFPVWLFDVDSPDQALARPTFGFTLTGGKGVGAGINRLVRMQPWPVRFGVDIFHTSQEAWDARFVSHSTRVRTVTVNAGNVGTTQFNLTADDQQMLIDNGRAAAQRFLDAFDLTDYENSYHRTLDLADRPPPPPATVGVSESAGARGEARGR